MMQPTLITELRADLVPHRHWALSRWFYANPIWYYHRRSASHEIRRDGKFYQLVDPDLREVCRLLNDIGIRTTPSCQGHSYPRERFERIWEELRREEPLIRGPGLIVKDCENDQLFLFQEANYQVPWSNFEDFYREAASHQNLGYLGMIVPAGCHAVARQLRADNYRTNATRLGADDELGQIFGGAVFELRVDATDPTTRQAEWRAFTNYLRDMLVPAGTCGASNN